METRVGHNMKEQILNWSQKWRVQSSRILLTRGHAPGVISCLLQLSKQPTTKRPLWQMTAWRTARGSCKAVFAWRSRRQRPSRSSRGLQKLQKDSLTAEGGACVQQVLQVLPPDRGSVPGEPVGHRGLLPRSGVASLLQLS